MAVILEEQKKVESRRSLDRNDLVLIENQNLKRENQGIWIFSIYIFGKRLPLLLIVNLETSLLTWKRQN